MVSKMIESLIDKAKKEEWDDIDEELPGLVSDPEYRIWASNEGLYDEDGNVRDLAVSIIEISEIPKEVFDVIRQDLAIAMTKDSNPYVRFRSAFALAKHGAGEYEDAMMKTLHDATLDEDVADIANDYLRNLNSKK